SRQPSSDHQRCKPEPGVDETELYSGVASLYRDHRPDYPPSLVRQAIELARLTDGDELLEIGCGPATATVPFAQAGFQIHCLEPSAGMRRVASEVCREFDRVSIQQSTLADYQPDSRSFNAVLAASSFHWALGDGMIQKVHDILRPGGALILFWNLPPEPADEIRSDIAKTCGLKKPFYFGDYSEPEHQQNIQQRVIEPLCESGLFSRPTESSQQTVRNTTPDDYLGFVQTLSPYIRMPTEQRLRFLDCAGRVLKQAGETIRVRNTCLLHVAHRVA
ncbi:MAG: class I SAM-dependent methyltransferase, partial [Planctomycetota bacterium]